MDDFQPLIHQPTPTARSPLLGTTVLVVEDSRFACEAFRLLCLKSGARIRRADSLRSAHRHLQVYRPTAVIVDLGLPDGSGLDLIQNLSQASNRVQVILGTSGDIDGKPRSLAMGADGFLHKPIENLSAFQAQILQHFPDEWQPSGLRPVSNDTIHPDEIALRDDLQHVQTILHQNLSSRDLAYVTQFTKGVARTALDKPLQHAAETLARHHAERRDTKADIVFLQSLLNERLTEDIAI